MLRNPPPASRDPVTTLKHILTNIRSGAPSQHLGGTAPLPAETSTTPNPSQLGARPDQLNLPAGAPNRTATTAPPRRRSELLPNGKMRLSTDKQAFRDTYRGSRSEHLPIESLALMAQHYEAEHHFQVLVNGDGHQLRDSQRAWQAERSAQLSSDAVFETIAKELLGQLPDTERAHLADVAKPFFNWVSPQRLGELDANQLGAFAQAVRNDPVLKPRFDAQIRQHRQNLGRDSEAVGLSPEAAADDLVKTTEKSKGEQQPIGYLYQNKELTPLKAAGVAKGPGHTDTYITSPHGRVLNLVGYSHPGNSGVAKALMEKKQPYASMELSSFMPHGLGSLVNPQAGDTECGPLGLSCMKEYLKDNAKQLREHCVVITGLENADKRGDILFPSAETLRYSQSALFVKVAEAMVRGKGEMATVEHSGVEFEVPTLAGLAKQGAGFEGALGGSVELDAFRQRWLDALEKSLPKRDAMNFDSEFGERNGYLAHVVDRQARRVAGSTPDGTAG